MVNDFGINWDLFKTNRKAIHALKHGCYSKYKYYHDDGVKRLIDNRDEVFPRLSMLSFLYGLDLFMKEVR